MGETKPRLRRLLDQFCRVCKCFTGGEKNWSGHNYCSECSPDPRE